MAQTHSYREPHPRRICGSRDGREGRYEPLRLGFRREPQSPSKPQSVEGRPQAGEMKQSGLRCEVIGLRSEVRPPAKRYSCSIPRCATPMLSRVEFFTIYII